ELGFFAGRRLANARKEQLHEGGGVALVRFGDPNLLLLSRLASDERPERLFAEGLNQLVSSDHPLICVGGSPPCGCKGWCRGRGVSPVRPEIVARLCNHPFAEGLSLRSLGESRKDSSELLMHHRVVAIHLAERAEACLSRSIWRAQTAMKPEDVQQIEERVFVESLLKVAVHHFIKKRLRFLHVAEGFKESGRHKRGAQSSAWPVVGRSHAFCLRKGAQGVLHPANGHQAVGADSLHKGPKPRIFRRDINMCSIQKVERS